MRTSFAVLTALSLASKAYAGTIDNSDVESEVDSSAVGFTGVYKLQNVDSGKYMTFYRDDDTDTTNFMMKDDGNVTLTYLEDQTGSDGTFSGTRIYGLSKCASAQWDFFGELEGDYAAVSYACAIGDDQTSTSGIHVAKQLWSFVECGSGTDDDDDDDSSSSSSSSSASSSSHAASSTKKAEILAAVASSSSSASKTSASATSTSTSPYASMTKCTHNQQWSYQRRSDATVADVCAEKIKKFEARHPELKADFRRMTKRDRHRHLARADGLVRHSEQYYCIVAQDHLDDMETRVITGKNKSTYGDYTSLALAAYDSSSVTDAMRWTVTEA